MKFNSSKIWIVLVAALLLRFAFIGWALSEKYVEKRNGLASMYLLQGYALCGGYGYIFEPGLATLPKFEPLARQGRVTPELAADLKSDRYRPEMLHPPGTALIVAALHLLVGGPADLPLEIFGAFIDSFAAVLLYLLVRRYFSERMAFVAGLLYALYPPMAYMSTFARMPDGWMTAFIIGTLACVLKSLDVQGSRGFVWAAVGGLVLGMGSYFRPDYLLMPVVMGVAYWIVSKNFRRSVAVLLTTQIVAFAVLVPWAVRNYLLCGRAIFTSSSVGMTLVTGLGEYSNPWGFGGSDEDRKKQALAQGYETATSAEADDYFRRLFWKCVRENPKAYLTTLVRRTPMTIFAPQSVGFENPWKTVRFGAQRAQGKDWLEIIRTQLPYVLKAYWEWLLTGFFGLIAIGCSALMCIFERRRFGLVLLLVSPHIYSITTHWLTHFESRFILPSMFCVIIGFAYILAGEWRSSRSTSKIVASC